MKNPSPVGLVEMIKRVDRAWGHYLTLFRTKKFCIKILCFKEKSRLSLQRHRFRSEFWVLLSGWGSMHLGGEGYMFSMDTCLIRPNKWHCFASHTPCTILEIQYGPDVREDDIERAPL